MAQQVCFHLFILIAPCSIANSLQIFEFTDKISDVVVFAFIINSASGIWVELDNSGCLTLKMTVAMLCNYDAVEMG